MSHITLMIPVVKEDGTKGAEGCIVALAGDVSEVSDGYHTFGELYEHRHMLFCALARVAFDLAFRGQKEALYCWKSSNHWVDGKLESVWPGWFLAGIELRDKMITYHLPLTYWSLFYGIDRDTPPKHDEHTSADVIERLKEWLKS